MIFIMIKLEVDGYTVLVKAGSTVRQAADALNIELPRFCYHERLRVAGNCRICLVEVIGSPKPVASCAMPVSNGIKVFTSSPLVKKARESVIELLRANHPLDCPICDQGGECDLQDQSIRYGSDRTRMYEPKRGVEDKYLGPLVKIVITRCIHCTRCIRFASEVAGVGVLGTSGRGSDTEVGTYVERVMHSELSGNLVDRCPVGALTSKPIAFKARSWELDSIDTYDDTDSLISSIRVQTIGNTVYRVIPRNNDDVNGQWIGDKGRFIIDAYNTMRAKRVMVRLTNDSYNIIDSMVDGVDYVGAVLDNMVNTLLIVSPSIDIASMKVVKSVFNNIPDNSSLLTLGYSSNLIRSGYKSEYSSMTELINRSNTDVSIIIGSDLRKESPVVNAMIRNGYMNGAIVLSHGCQLRDTYPVESLSSIDMVSLYNGTSNIISMVMKADDVSTIVGTSIMQRDTASLSLSALRDMASLMMSEAKLNVNHYVLHTRANTVGAMVLGMPGYDSMVNYNAYNSMVNIGVLATDIIEQGISTIDINMTNISYTSLFTPWLDGPAGHYDVVMPLVINHEQESVLVNTETRYNIMKKVVTGTLTSDVGSVNSFMLSSLFMDGEEIDNIIVGSYYTKRLSLLSSIYEAIDNDCDVSNVPAVHDYYMEGHSGLIHSTKMVECSVVSNIVRTFSE